MNLLGRGAVRRPRPSTRVPRGIFCSKPVSGRMRRLAIGGGVTIGIVTYSGSPGPSTDYDALAYEDAMKRRSKAGGELTKERRRTAPKPERRNAPKDVAPSNWTPASEETRVAQLTRELNDALSNRQPQRTFFELSAAPRLIYKPYSTHWPNPLRFSAKPMRQQSGVPMAAP